MSHLSIFMLARQQWQWKQWQWKQIYCQSRTTKIPSKYSTWHIYHNRQTEKKTYWRINFDKGGRCKTYTSPSRMLPIRTLPTQLVSPTGHLYCDIFCIHIGVIRTNTSCVAIFKLSDGIIAIRILIDKTTLGLLIMFKFDLPNWFS